MIDLITGHQGVNHISAVQVATLNNRLTGDIGVNKVVRILDGEISADGLGITIGTGYWRANGYDMEITEAETILFDPTDAGLQRIDGVYIEILQDIASGVQRSEIVVVQGEAAVSPTAPDAPTDPQYTTDILKQCELIGQATIDENAMTFVDSTIEFEINAGGSLFIDSEDYISVDYEKIKKEE